MKEEEILKIIAGRIEDERRKHPTLNWQEIAAKKIYTQWFEYLNTNQSKGSDIDAGDGIKKIMEPYIIYNIDQKEVKLLDSQLGKELFEEIKSYLTSQFRNQSKEKAVGFAEWVETNHRRSVATFSELYDLYKSKHPVR